MSFILNGKVLVYFSQNHLSSSILEGFQFIDNFTEIADAPKGDTKKFNLLIKDLECTLQFDNPSTKQKWLTHITQSKKSPEKEGPLSKLMEEANKNYSENSDFWFTQKMLYCSPQICYQIQRQCECIYIGFIVQRGILTKGIWRRNRMML